MVAAAKLRRAQEAAEAARPYSQRMGAVLANIAATIGADDGAPRPDDRHRQGRRAYARRLHRRAWSVRWLQLQIARFARDHARQLIRDGKTVKIFCVGKRRATTCVADSLR